MPGGSSYNGAGKFPTISIKEAKTQCRNCVALADLFRSIVGADMIQRFHMVKKDSNSDYLPKDLISCRLIDKICIRYTYHVYHEGRKQKPARESLCYSAPRKNASQDF